jgi:hypothetical protein
MIQDGTPNPQSEGHSTGDGAPPPTQSDLAARSHLFLVRVWEGDGTDTTTGPGAVHEAEWHGKAQNVVTGEAQRFDGLDHLGDVLRAMAGATRDEARTTDGTD